MIIHNPIISGSIQFPADADGNKVTLQVNSGVLETIQIDSSNNATSVKPESNLSGSFTGSFQGDGSALTGVSSINIDALNSLGGATVAQGDNLVISDAGTEKKVTFSNLEDSIFGNISGNATIAAGGVLTIASSFLNTSLNAATGSYLTTVDISDDTNLAVSDTSEVNMILNGDTLSAELIGGVVSGSDQIASTFAQTILDDTSAGAVRTTIGVDAAGTVNYTLPTNLAGDDIDIDTTPLTGATVISDLDINITTNTSGLVTDANGTVSTRDLTPSDLGLGNVDNTTDAGKPVSTAQQSALDLKANIASPTFTGTPISTTPSANDDSTKIATTAYVQQELTDLIGTADSTVDTLGELSASLANDSGSLASLVTTVGTKLAKSSNLSDLTNVGTARTNLGLVIGTDVQAFNSTLGSVAGGTYAGDNSIVTIGTVTTGNVQAILPSGVVSGSDQVNALASDVNNNIITFTAGDGLDGGGVITLNQSSDETVTFTVSDGVVSGSDQIASTFAQTILDDADAGEVRTTIGVDAAGTDNSTDVTLTGNDYLTISGQAITVGAINNDDLTNSSITIDGSTISLGGSVTTTNTQLSTEAVQDIVGAMFSGNTETRISVTYQDGDGTIDLVADDMTANDNTQNTTTLSFVDSTNDIILRNTTSGASSGTDDIKFVAGSNITLTHTDADNITISSTDTNTVYSHPTFDGDDISIDTTALTGATVISDLDFNITTDTNGHVTDANGSVATRTLTATDLSLGNVTNESKATMFASPALTGNPTAPTQADNDNSTKIATTAYVQREVSDLLGGAPAAFDTLLEISASIANGDSDVVSLTTVVGGKLQKDQNLSDLTNAGTARTNLGVDVAGTDNSTDVTLANTNYLSISGQAITGGTIPIGSGGTGATSAGAARTALGVDAAGTDNSTDVTLVTTSHDYLGISGQAITLGTIQNNDLASSSITINGSVVSLGGSVTTPNDNTQLSTEAVQDIVGGMLGGTETGITVTYQDSTGDIDFVVASQTDENFTTDDHSKLDGIEAGANVTDTGNVHPILDDKLVVSGSATQVRSFLNVESGADVTDTSNVTAAGALMDSEVDVDLKTFALPANTTISAFGKTIVDDTSAGAVRTTIGVDAAGTDNSTDVTLVTTSHDYLGISGQEITLGAINNDDLTNSAITIDGTSVSLGGSVTTANDNTQLTQEQVEDFVGGMLDGTETGITVGYDDVNGNLDFVVASQTDNNFTTTLKDKLDGIAESANNYVLPTNLAGDDIDIDTTALTGATVISDLDINITTDTSGRVTDANGSVGTRTLTLANLGYTGDTDATDDQTATEIRTLIGSGNNGHVPSVGSAGHFLKHDGTFGIPSYTTNTDVDVSVANLKTRLGSSFGSNAVSIGDSNDTVTIPGDLVVTGTTTTNNVEVVSTTNGVVFEGSAADAHEGTLLAGTLSADRTYTLPNKTGTVAMTSDITGTNSNTNTGDETKASINALDITEVGTISSGTWQGSAIATTYLSGQSGTNTGDETQASINALNITEVGTISSGTWNGSVIASAYLDSDTAHLSGTQTFSGAKTFSNSTASTTKTTGAVIVTGGVGISGALNVGGDIVAYASSDERLKDNIQNIENPIEKVQSLKGVTWDWNDNADELQQSLPNVGVIAQDVEKILHQLVTDRDNGFKGVDYAKLTGLLIEAIKEQQKQIDDLKSKVK